MSERRKGQAALGIAILLLGAGGWMMLGWFGLGAVVAGVGFLWLARAHDISAKAIRRGDQ